MRKKLNLSQLQKLDKNTNKILAIDQQLRHHVIFKVV